MNKQSQISPEAIQKLSQFEEQLDVEKPEAGPFGPRIIGYGEISTVFTFEDPDLAGRAYKRMAIFHTDEELDRYEADYLEYNQELVRRSILLPDFGSVRIKSQTGITLYLFQGLLNSANICNKLIQRLPQGECLQLFQHILETELAFFQKNTDTYALGFDGQLSNWALIAQETANRLPEKVQLAYIDTSLPLMRKDGVEQANPELFLRICPGFLVAVIRAFFLDDVMNRYYDFRLVVLDLVAQLYKENRIELIEPFLTQANSFFRAQGQGFAEITAGQVKSYYREDAIIWRLFLFARRLEQKIQIRLLKKKYPVILPGKIKR